MMSLNNPQYVKVDDKLYKINTDFRVALECNKIAEDESIGNLERAMAIIYKLFGEDGLDCENQNKQLELGMKYLLLGREQKSLKNDSHDKYELDFNKCIGLIKATNEFYKKEAEIYDMFLGKDGVKKLLNGRKLTLARLDEIDEIIEKAILPKLQIKAEDIKKDIMAKYSNKAKRDDVIE